MELNSQDRIRKVGKKCALSSIIYKQQFSCRKFHAEIGKALKIEPVRLSPFLNELSKSENIAK